MRALLHFFLDENAKAGYVEVNPPIFVNAASATATGQLPDKEGQMYETTPDHLYAVPTAEVPLTNFFRDEIVEEIGAADLSLRLHAVFPSRGGQLWQGCARAEPAAPVRQGRAAEMGASRRPATTSSTSCATTPSGCCRNSICRIACC